MLRLLLLFLLASCHESREKSPSHSCYPIPGREEILPNGKKLRRPLVKAEVPTGWIASLQEGAFTNLDKPNISFEISPDLHLSLFSYPPEESPPFPEKSPQEQGDFCTAVMSSPGKRVFLYRLKPHLQERLNTLGRTFEEEAYFHQMCSTFVIDVEGREAEIELHRDEIAFFTSSLSFFLPLPMNQKEIYKKS